MPNYVALINGVLTEVVQTAGAPVTATVNFTSPGYESVFTVTDANVTATSKISIVSAIPVGDADEIEFDQLQVTAIANTGSFKVYVMANPAPVFGQYTITYLVN